MGRPNYSFEKRRKELKKQKKKEEKRLRREAAKARKAGVPVAKVERREPQPTVDSADLPPSGD